MSLAKRLYVSGMRVARHPARWSGLLRALERGRSRRARHLRSLFAIYDAADMVRLDLAWWTFEAMARVDAHLAAKAGHARVFEYGAGASTVWLARRAAHVRAVEHDAGWAARLRPLLRDYPQATIGVVPPVPCAGGTPPRAGSARFPANFDFQPYVEAIRDAGGPFDLIVVDGRARLACFREAKAHLAKGGMILLDDTERADYAPAFAEPGLTGENTHGTKACLPYKGSTALFTAANGG